MPPQLQLVRQWLERAAADLGMAQLAQDNPKFTPEAGFHCQQAVEKALKAFLTHAELAFVKTHDLRSLLEACVTADRNFARFEGRIEGLTDFAVQFRYPRLGADPSVAEIHEALTIAREVYQFVLQQLPPSVRP